MTLARILVATDFSDQADIAVAKAAAIAAHKSAELVLLHVDSDPEPPMPGLTAGTKAYDEYKRASDEHRVDSRKQLETIAARYPTLQTSCKIGHGHPDEIIVEIGSELEADLIVTGTHGRTGLARFFLGSVAEKVVRAARTNVLVTREGELEDRGFESILVPTDFSPANEKALKLAISLAAPGATIELFHAWQYPPGTHAHQVTGDEGPMAELRDEILRACSEYGERWIEAHGHADVTIRFAQDYGPAASVVQDRLAAGSYDLVATGTHGYRGFRRFVLGSVAEATVRHSPCSVLVGYAGDLAAS